MSKQWQIRRGTTIDNEGFTGAIGELTMDTDKKQLRVHDGETLGGAGVIDPVVAYQLPTAGNNYTWCRRYASGWVEQGGQLGTYISSQTITLPVEMADTNYSVYVCAGNLSGTGTTGYERTHGFGVKTTTTVYFDTFSGSGITGYWEVKGMAAQGE